MLELHADPITINCRKVLAGLQLMDAPYKLVHVDYFKGAQKEMPHIGLNPNASVPAMRDGAFELWESNAILMYAADKAQHLHELVLPALRRGAVVISDRYVDSMLAYQGAGRVLEPERVEQIARWATDDLLPDLTVLLDLDPAKGVAGIQVKDRVEGAGADFHVRARQFFLDLAADDTDHYLVLPARTGIKAIGARVRARVASLLSAPAGTVNP